MKYVIFEQEGTGLKMPVLFPDHVTHNMVNIEGMKIVSAGFCLIGGDEIVTIPSDVGESLNIGPAEGDRGLIIATLCNAGVYAFLNF